MDIEKLIERLRDAGWTNPGLTDKQSLEWDAAETLSTLQAENAQLRADLEYEREHADAYYEECGQWEAENEKLRAELERMKEIMRYNGIMVIPSKYPGGRSEWNIPKPRG